MYSYFVVVLLVLSISRDVRSASYEVKMSQQHTRVSKDRQRVVAKCTADAELSGCQFRWWDRDGTAGPPLDFSSGNASRADPHHLSDSVSSYSYYGAGLDKGECGISLRIEGWKCWMVACRVSVAGGGWTYAWMDIYAEIWDYLPNTVGERVAVVLPGQDLRLTMNARKPLACCRFHLPSRKEDDRLDFDDGVYSDDSSGRHRYYGAGLYKGECGITVSNVTEADNGPSRGYIRSTSPSTDDQRFIPTVVAQRPSSPVLSVVSQGSNVTATCEVQQSRPIADITWLLGDDVIRKDTLDDSPSNATDEWRWPWMGGSITQRVTFTLTPKYERDVLTCRVSHVTLEQPLEATHRMTGGHAGVDCASSKTNSCTTPASSLLDILCHGLGTSEPGSCGCPRDEIYKLRLQEAGALARAAEMAEGAAKSKARVEVDKTLAAELMLQAARARAKAEEAWATNAEEELQFERERRKLGHPQLQTPQGA